MNLPYKQLLIACIASLTFTYSFSINYSPNVSHSDNEGPSFIENKGQLKTTLGESASNIRYYAHNEKSSIYVLRDGLSFVFNSFVPGGKDKDIQDLDKDQNGKFMMHRVDLAWRDANKNIHITASEAGKAKINYFNSSTDGVTDLSTYKKLTLHDIYPSIDMDIYFKGSNLKYDFVVRPGGDPNMIKLAFHGADQMQLREDGTLQFNTTLGQFNEGRPITFQEGFPIDCKYVVKDGVVKFNVGSYDKDRTLIIDPLREWSTYFGGTDYEFISKITTGPSGDVYVCGSTFSPDFPITPGAYDTAINGSFTEDIFISRFDPEGNLIWSTYYGGSQPDIAKDIAVDENEDIHVFGHSISSDFPYTWGGYTAAVDLVKLHFDSTGNRISATMFGGNGNDYAFGISNIPGGGTYLTGQTTSSDYPTTWGCHQAAIAGGSDMFVTQLSASGSIVWSTYMGGIGIDLGYDIVSDTGGCAVVTGYTWSADFPTTGGCFQDSIAGKNDAVLARFTPSGALVWSTYFGGNWYDVGWGIGIDPSNDIYLAGETSSNNLSITPGKMSDTLSGPYDFMLAKFDPNGNRDWATYWGGTGTDAAYDIKWDDMGYFHAVGRTNSTDLPVSADAVQINNAGSYDAAMLTFNSNGNQMKAGYFGGSQYDVAYSVAPLGDGTVIFAGECESTDMLVDSNAHQSTAMGNWDGWLAKFDFCEGLSANLTPTDEICLGTNGTIDLVVNGGNSPNTFNWSNGKTTEDVSGLIAGTYSVIVTDNIGCTATANVVVSSSSYTPTVSLGNDTSICFQDSKILDAGPGFVSYVWNGTPGSQTATASNAGMYVVTATDANNCSATDTISIAKIGPNTEFNKTVNNLQVTFTDITGTGVAWSWDFGDGQSTTQQHPTHTYNSTGTYIACLTVTDMNGCQQTKCDTMFLSIAASIDELSNNIHVYPNPVTDHLFVEFDKQIPTPVTWKVVDITGKVMMQSTETAFHNSPQKTGSQRLELSLRDLPNGAYGLVIEGWPSQKFVVQR